MKILMVAIIAVFYSFVVKAQDSRIFKRKPWEEYKLKSRLRDTLNRIFSFPPGIKTPPSEVVAGVIKLPLKGTFLGINGTGDKIFAMQPDRMPCLVPNKNTAYNMPVAGIEKNDLNIDLSVNINEGKKGETEKSKQNK